MKQEMIKFRINNNRQRSYRPLLLSLLCLFFVHFNSYAWRVRAIAKSGIEETPVIKNNGYSPVFWFDYAADCKTVQTIGAIYENGHVNITWQDVGAAEYTAEYRKKGSSKWYTGSIVQPGLCPVYNLQFGKEYEYRIGSRCVANDIFQYSAIKAIQIPDKADKSPNCGIMPDSKIANKVPAQQLQHGLPVLAGDFPVFITKIEGSGHFSGEGYVGIPYLSNLQVAVTFKDIVVNTDNKLISGYFETKYDPVNNMIFDVDKTLTGGKGVGDIRSGEEKASYTVNYSINPNLKALPVKADSTKDEITEGSDYTFTKGENGKYTFILTDSEGKEHKLETDTVPATIQDKNGNTFEINDKGNIAPISGKTDIHLDDATKNTPHPEIATLSFETTKNTKYAVDSYKEVYAKVTEFFLKYKPSNEDMIASAKFMTPGSSDEIFVKVETPSEKFNPEKIHFITDKGKEYQGKYDGSTGWTLTVLGSAPDDGQHLYVVQEESPGKYATLARLNIYSYEPKKLKVKLVPINGFTNGFTKETVSQQLNAIYNKVGITCEVEMASSFDYEPLKTAPFNVTGSGLFSTETNDMKALQTTYIQANPETDTITLFIIKDVTGADGVTGDMPRKKQFGYLFPDATPQTIAHEIGHGVFHLDHPFERTNAAKSFAKGDLKGNLMEYVPYNGDQLVKLQWDAMHATGIVIGVFERDAGAMAQNIKGIHVKEKALYAMPGARLIELEDITILPICSGTGYNGNLYSFIDKQGITWVPNDNNENAFGYYFSDYINSKTGKPLSKSTKIVKDNDVAYKISYQSNNQLMEIIKITFGQLDPSVLNGNDVYSIFERADGYTGNIKTSELLYSATVPNPCENTGGSNAEQLLNNLKTITANTRTNQDVELEYWNKAQNKFQYFTIGNGKLVEIQKPLTDEQIYAGEWPDKNIETKRRWTVNSNGIIQFKSLGFRKDLVLYRGKTANLQKVSKHIKEQTNKFLSDNNVNNFSKKPTTNFVNSGETFVDGKQIVIGNNSSFIKIINEGIGVTTTLLKTGEIEEDVYKESTEKTATIHAPGVVTGSVEVVAQKVTDITSLGTLIYDVAVDKETRSQLYTQFKEIKDEIGEDPKNFLPILVDVVVTVTTNKTPEQIQSIFDAKTDAGQRTHYAVSSTGNTIVTAVAGAAIVKDLPEIAERLTENIKKVKNLGKYDWGTVKRYFQHIQEVTGRAISQKQIDRLKDALRNKEYKKLSKEEYDTHRADFNTKREKLIEEWEKETGQKWPVLDEDVYNSQGEFVVGKGRRYDAHHIIEVQYGGENEWWNIHPAKFPDEHQGGIHGVGSPSRELFK